MSDDIVKRLRKAEVAGVLIPCDDLKEAADEIERLRDDAAQQAGALRQEKDEVERLRDIVEKVAMGSFLNDTMYEAIKDARKYISAMPMQ